ncbi:MAG: class D beta-lactamase [Ignavibacteriales bacterium]|nr:class D beta-lactamase [Ignavibacteriales bacterium]
MKIIAKVFIALFAVCCIALSQKNNTVFDAIFKEYNVKGCFVLYDFKNDTFIRYNEQRCNQRFIPASTFKYLNSLIALETGVIRDEHDTIRWDDIKRFSPAWNQDHDLQSAFKVSAVWYYQELARRIGEKQMKQYITKVQYGNNDISGGIDKFWLEGGLRISPEEQIGFLKKLYNGGLPFSKRAMDIVKNISVVEETPSYTLHGKTGWAVIQNVNIGWYAGYVEKGGNVFLFATNIETRRAVDNFPQARTEITKKLLKDLGVI